MADPIRDRHRPAVPPRTETCRRPSRHSHLPTGSTTHFWHIHPCRADSRSLLRTGRADAKTSHADSGVLLRQPGATSNSWGGFFPPKKSLAPLPPQKDTPTPASQICNTLLPGITFQTVTSMLFSCLASCLLSSKEVWIPQMLHVSHTSPTHPHPLISEAAGSTSTQVLVSNPLFSSGRAPQNQHQESAWEILLPTTQYCS